jgi:hypothetical protein
MGSTRERQKHAEVIKALAGFANNLASCSKMLSRLVPEEVDLACSPFWMAKPGRRLLPFISPDLAVHHADQTPGSFHNTRVVS